jgi:hypothetical protein
VTVGINGLGVTVIHRGGSSTTVGSSGPRLRMATAILAVVDEVYDLLHEVNSN